MCCGFILCGLSKRDLPHDGVPSNYPPVEGTVVCPYCSHKGKPEYRRKKMYYTFFFIPLFPVKWYDPYVACRSCRAHVGTHGCFICRNCRTAAPHGFKYCIKCGNDLQEENKICL
jgi:hypothetical protein